MRYLVQDYLWRFQTIGNKGQAYYSYYTSEQGSVLVNFFPHSNLGDNDPSKRLKIEEYAGPDKASTQVTGMMPHSLVRGKQNKDKNSMLVDIKCVSALTEGWTLIQE